MLKAHCPRIYNWWVKQFGARTLNLSPEAMYQRQSSVIEVVVCALNLSPSLDEVYGAV